MDIYNERYVPTIILPNILARLYELIEEKLVNRESMEEAGKTRNRKFVFTNPIMSMIFKTDDSFQIELFTLMKQIGFRDSFIKMLGQKGYEQYILEAQRILGNMMNHKNNDYII